MNVRLFHGDAFDLLATIPNGSIDLILTDPPYNTTHCSFDIPFDKERWWKEIWRVAKDNAAILIFGQEPFSSTMRLLGGKFRYDYIWEKSNAVGFLNVSRRPLRAHEVISVFFRRLPTYNPQFTKGTPYTKSKNQTRGANYRPGPKYSHDNDGFRHPRDVIKMSRPCGVESKWKHPQQKPEKLIEFLIRTYSNEGDTVLDTFMGSGSVGSVALQLNRNFIGSELSEEWFVKASERINEVKEKGCERRTNQSNELIQ